MIALRAELTARLGWAFAQSAHRQNSEFIRAGVIIEALWAGVAVITYRHVSTVKACLAIR